MSTSTKSRDKGINGRCFQEIHIAQRCSVQLAESRYGPGVRSGINEMLATIPAGMLTADLSTVSEADGPSQSFPQVARGRCNLTALSQRYNLYFVAYGEEIHVFTARRSPHILGPPDVVFKPPETRPAGIVGGYQDSAQPHQMNHIVVGDLGNEEILLMAMDDGDVCAYYTAEIAQYILSASNSRRRDPRAFFHENVGASAWGLAVHSQSRLIAVSSNHHEITVFAYALNDQAPAKEVTKPIAGDLPISEHFWNLQKQFRSRSRSWRIVFPFNTSASNIPSISFADDKYGHADYVVGVDINGTTWLSMIWRLFSPPIRIRHCGDQGHGWAIKAISDEQLQPTKTLDESFGLPLKQFKYIQNSDRWWKPFWFAKADYWADISRTMVNDKWPTDREASYHSMTHGAAIGTDDEVEEEEDDIDENIPHDLTMWDPEMPPARWPRNSMLGIAIGESIDEGREKLQGFHLASTIIPARGWYLPEFTFEQLLGFLGRRQAADRSIAVEYGAYPKESCSRDAYPGIERINFLRTSKTDVDMCSLKSRTKGVVCRGVVEHRNPRSLREPWDMRHSERCSMLLFVPEISLAVIGSACGRVGLLTLTRPPKDASLMGGSRWKLGFRVEHILPRDSEEDLQLRPQCCLLGVAISPMPESNTHGLDLRRRDAVGLPTRWRLVLNYMDHTILLYDISKTTLSVDVDLVF